jgi:hypothetical protein
MSAHGKNARSRRYTGIYERLLILDEATEGLAPLIQAEICQCLAQQPMGGVMRRRRRCG